MRIALGRQVRYAPMDPHERTRSSPAERHKPMRMKRTCDLLALLRADDRERLLNTDDARLLGLVMELNRTPRYHNRLDALQLAALILRKRRRLP